MRSLWSKLAIACVCTLGIAGAQLLPGNAAGVSMGHLHLRVKDVPGQMKLWRDVLGGKESKFGSNMQRVVLSGMEILVQEAENKGGTVGSSIDHVGFQVRDLAATLAKAKAAGITISSQDAQKGVAFLMAPDDIKIELLERKDIQGDVAVSHHIHFLLDGEGVPAEMQAWYVKEFGATPGKRGPSGTADLPGSSLTFGVSPTPVVGTRGRALDHIGFEIKNMEAYAKKLEADGVKLTTPFRLMPQLGISLAFVADPKGTGIELNETLERK
jgi:catechol 2,3-dioxygenase-like lactoylglutathione lyase family enzyme